MTQSMESAAMEARNHSALCSQRSGPVVVRGSASTTCRGSCALAPTRTTPFWVAAARPQNCQPDAKFASNQRMCEVARVHYTDLAHRPFSCTLVGTHPVTALGQVCEQSI